MDASVLVPIGIAGLAVTALLIVWIYGDAELHGQDGAFWAVIVLFFSLPGAMVYFFFFRHGFAIKFGKKPAESRPPRAVHPVVPRGPTQPDTGFFDEELDLLISEGRFDDARAYLEKTVRIMREMGDEKGLANYLQYEWRIERAASQSARGRYTTDL